jgi:hypothetical protein
MKIKSQRDFWSGLMFLVVGGAFAWGSMEYSFGTSARPGPGYFPFGLGIVLAVLGGLVLFKALTLESEGGDPVGAIAWRPLIIIFTAIVVFGLALPRLGLICTLPLTVLLSSLAGREFHWRDVLISSALLTAGSWALFIKGLKLTLPVWPIYFG